MISDPRRINPIPPDVESNSHCNLQSLILSNNPSVRQ
uniref:Uncharacterized protein n=1 Tax=viral metagenome TaxID=1070528 RepID=A0A6C0BL12_9ZZZZ